MLFRYNLRFRVSYFYFHSPIASGFRLGLHIASLSSKQHGKTNILNAHLTPAIRDFLEQIEDSKSAFIEKDYHGNGRLGPLIVDITDPPESENERRYMIDWHEFSRIDCHGDADVVSSLDELRSRSLTDQNTQLMIAETFYRDVHKNIKARLKSHETLMSPVREAFEASTAIYDLSAAWEHAPIAHRVTDTFVTAVKIADEKHEQAIFVTGDVNFYLDIERFKQPE
jgi:hypothetical protein